MFTNVQCVENWEIACYNGMEREKSACYHLSVSSDMLYIRLGKRAIFERPRVSFRWSDCGLLQLDTSWILVLLFLCTSQEI